jgi:hypothetical protein
MRTPLDELIDYTDELQHLNMVEEDLLRCRLAHPTNQQVQLDMDRYQTQVDNRRAQIEVIMLIISSMN